MEPLVVRGRSGHGDKVMMTVTMDGLETALCGLIPWSAIARLRVAPGAHGTNRLEIYVHDRSEYARRIDRRWLRLFTRAVRLFGGALLGFPERVIGMTPEELRAEIELRAGRSFPR